jgi:dolichyl-phosphate-mannose--protein O-mannosyl transferase
MAIIIYIIGFLLLLFSIIDLKFRQIPSVYLTGSLFLIIALFQNNIYTGLLAFVFAYLLYELDFIGGVADIKIIVLIGFMISSFFNLAIFMILVVLYGGIWKALIKFIYKKEQEFAFLPVLFFTYLALVVAKLIGV